MGKNTYNASKDLKAIGDEIARQYAAGQFETLPDLITTDRTYTDIKGRTYYIEAEQIRFTVGTLRVRCEDSPEAVARIVARYRKGLPRDIGQGKLRGRSKIGRGTDFGALAVVEHEAID